MKQQFTLFEVADALYEYIAEPLARQYGKAGALSFFRMMGEDVQFFWCDIARQIINHSKEWEQNQGCCCVLSKRERERLRKARLEFEEAAKQPTTSQGQNAQSSTSAIG